MYDALNFLLFLDCCKGRPMMIMSRCHTPCHQHPDGQMMSACSFDKHMHNGTHVDFNHSVLGTAICCWFFHCKHKRRDLHAITGKGGVIVLSDDLQRANQEGRLLFNVALVNVRVCT